MKEISEPIHMSGFVSNLKEVDRLSDIHSIITPQGPGRKHNVQILHKSSVVLLVACWEAYVEDLATNALSLIVTRIKNHTNIPKDVRERIASRNQGMKAWSLAGEGWKQACLSHLNEVLAKTTGTFNTPKTDQVDDLFEKVIGLKNISSNWHWKGRSASKTKAALDSLVELRGSIAHRVSASRVVRKNDVSEARELLARLAVKSHNAANRHLTKIIGSKPWEGFWFNETR